MHSGVEEAPPFGIPVMRRPGLLLLQAGMGRAEGVPGEVPVVCRRVAFAHQRDSKSSQCQAERQPQWKPLTGVQTRGQARH